MKPGDMVTIDEFDRTMYSDVSGHHRIFVGTFKRNCIALCVDAGFSSTDIYYVRILTGDAVGWIRAEVLKYL